MTQPLPSTLSPGTLLRDTYVIQDRLAVGGMGEIYAATHVRLPGRFAIKVLAPQLAGDPAAVARFCREAAIASLLRHPHIVQVIDFDVSHRQPFLVMECVPGQDLAEHLLLEGPLSLARVVPIIRQVASALEAAHQLGIVHRDLKPANVMLLACPGVTDFVKVLDFGVSKICGDEAGGRSVVGTPAYMAPEQAEGRSEEVGPRTDQFSLAVLTHALLTGASPFEGTSTADVLRQIVSDRPRPLGARVPWPSAAVDAVLARAMARDPRDRFPRASDLAAALASASDQIDGQLRTQRARATRNREKMCELDTVISLRPAVRSVASNRAATSQEVTIDSIPATVPASIPRVA